MRVWEGGQECTGVAGVVSEWQPIETAPKDGTRILATNGSRVFIAYWIENASVNPTEGPEEPHWIEFECEDYWYSVHLFGSAAPTHWMPLPAPPVDK